jgi:hypothetical protein
MPSKSDTKLDMCVANCKFASVLCRYGDLGRIRPRDLAVLFLNLLATVARLVGPGGARAVVAESVLVKHQLLILNRSRKRSPNLRPSDRVVAGLCAVFIRPGRLIRSAIVFKPSTLLRLHRALIQRKYRRLFSSKEPMKPGPKGPSQEVIAAVVDMKQRNPSWGCPRIAQQITQAFGIPIDREVVRRILAARYQPTPDSAGPSWLTLLGHAKDSLWSVDLFRCESAVLNTYWVLVVMDHWTRRIVGFSVHRGVVDGWRCVGCSITRRAASPRRLTSVRTISAVPVLRKNSIRAKCDEIRRARTSGSTPNVELDRDKSHRKVLDC